MTEHLSELRELILPLPLSGKQIFHQRLEGILVYNGVNRLLDDCLDLRENRQIRETGLVPFDRSVLRGGGWGVPCSRDDSSRVAKRLENLSLFG